MDRALGSSFFSSNDGDQFNAPGGSLNVSTGGGNSFNGATFHQPVYLGAGASKPPDSLQGCLRSLAFPDMDSRSNDIDTATPGTCKWLLRHETYRNWATCHRGLLWIKGNPGSGKSTLLRYAVDHVLASRNPGDRTLVLSFFFHGRGTELQKTPLGLFRSLLYQLRHIPGALASLVSSFEDKCKHRGKVGEQWQWHQKELQDYFASSLVKVLQSYPAWLFIDALDECGKENAIRLVRQLKSMLKRLPSSGSQFRICFACRHWPILDLDGGFEISLERENGQDISTYVRSQLSTLRGQMAPTIPDLVTERASGIFLWARLVVERILDLALEGEGEQIIKKEAIYAIPQDLDVLYLELIENMDKKPESLKLFQWICFAERPLSLDELRWALIVDVVDANYPSSLQQYEEVAAYAQDSETMEAKLKTLSRGLAETTLFSSTRAVQFIHLSVRDFFLEKGFSALHDQKPVSGNIYEPDPALDAHYRLSRTCLRYLAMEEIVQSTVRKCGGLRNAFPLLHYATTSWTWHASQSMARTGSEDDLLAYLAWPSESLVQLWVRIYNTMEPNSPNCPADGTSILHVLSQFQLIGPLRFILQSVDTDIDVRDFCGQTALSMALSRGDKPITRLLLEHRASTHLKSYVRYQTFAGGSWQHKIYDTSLWLALYTRQTEMLELLLQYNADPNAPSDAQPFSGLDIIDPSFSGRGMLPLRWAVMVQYEDATTLLLKSNADADSLVASDKTVLAWLGFSGHLSTMKLLLEIGVNPNSKSIANRTPLWYATKYQRQPAAELLLNYGADPNIPDSETGRTPLSWAVEFGHKTIVKLLLSHGANIQSISRSKRTPLIYAVENGHEAMTRLLLEQGASPDSKSALCDRTPLSWAAQSGHHPVVKQLLDYGADPNIPDSNNGRTPLSWAAERGHDTAVELLLSHGANLESESRVKRTPLTYAAESGREAITRLLLEKGAKPNPKDSLYNRTPLSLAALNGHDAVVELLLEKRPDVEQMDKFGRTPLHLAAQKGNPLVVWLLLKSGADIESRDRDGQTPLLMAVTEAHGNIVGFLHEQGANIEAKDEMGRTPLYLAVQKGEEPVVKLLLEKGAEVEAKDDMGRTPLYLAVQKGQEPIISLLLDKGADIESPDNGGQTPLMLAFDASDEATIELLLERSK